MSYPDNWDEIASEVRSRDDHTCQNCRRTDLQLDVHHIVPVSAGGSHRRSNLVTLCVDCHNAVHNDGVVAPTVDEEHSGGHDPVQVAKEAAGTYSLIRRLFR